MLPHSDAQDARAVSTCAWCHREIYAGSEVKRIDDSAEFVHAGFREDCAEKYAAERVYDRSGIIDENGDVI
ncbi:hypothetical protein [Cohnella silvisoli]|uniref:Uncharacterized protein n=1 Tax=Cohnella silvisoli TaxID=2873699 RepID=A0ABV1KZI9_9BACL|nr:hypothetical protein [Cohnella silvisoli]MCD9024356.1 hypothetical protein [Cohnella silvisoli]